MERRSQLLVALLLLLLLATALRFHRLDAQSFWNDEGNSARLSERSVALIIEGAAGDIHPPLYYLMLSGWRAMLGESEFALRALSAFSGVLVISAIFRAGRLLSDRKASVPFLAALLAAVHPALVYYSQEARMYELLGLWTILSTVFLLRLLPLLRDPGRSERRRALVLLGGAYGLAVVAGLYTHYFFAAVLLSHNLLLGWQLIARSSNASGAGAERLFTKGTGRILGRWALLMGATFLAYLPWLPIFLRQAGGRAGGDISAGAFLAVAGRWLALGPTVEQGGLWWALVAAVLLALLGLLPRRQQKPQTTGSHLQSLNSRLQNPLTLLILLAVPPLLMLLLGATRPAYHKFMVVSVPFLALLMARGALTTVPLLHGAPAWRRGVRGLSLLALVLLLSGRFGSLANLYYDPAFARDDYRGIAARIASDEHPDAGIILNAANQWEVFTYYHREGAPVYPIPRGRPDAGRIASELESIAARHDRLYALYWGAAERDPQRLVERWLDNHAFKAREEWVGDVRFVTYAVPQEPPTEMEEEANLRFGSHIFLEGYTLQGESPVAGDIVQVTLFWRSQAAVQTRYKVFLHLVDGGGQIVAQRDAEPGGNQAPTTTWQPGQVVRDNHGLLVPPETEPGHYALLVGLYPLDDPAARLTVQSTQSDGDRATSDRATSGLVDSDSYSLGSITVR